MKNFYLYLLFMLLGHSVFGIDPAIGYIVTKNGIQLTGKIGKIDHNSSKCSVIFINDFGNIYELFPELISGFVFRKDSTTIIFESKVESEERRWIFMQAITKGKGLNLYKSISEADQQSLSLEGMTSRAVKVQNYYLESKGTLPMKVKRWGFKKQVKELLEKKAPDLAKKIGNKGYRFKDLVSIIEEYNDLMKRSRKFL